MKAIIDEKLYDTDNAEMILKFKKTVTINYLFFMRKEDVDCELYQTKKGAWFEYIGCNRSDGYINELPEEAGKQILAKHNPELYMSLFYYDEA